VTMLDSFFRVWLVRKVGEMMVRGQKTTMKISWMCCFLSCRGCKKREVRSVVSEESVKKAASALPTSRSLNLRGRVEQVNLRSLLELIVALLNCRVLGTTAPPNEIVIDCMMSAFSPASSEHLGTEWETFRNVVLGSYVRPSSRSLQGSADTQKPNLMAILAAFIESTFQITNFFWLKAETLPTSPVRCAPKMACADNATDLQSDRMNSAGSSRNRTSSRQISSPSYF